MKHIFISLIGLLIVHQSIASSSGTQQNGDRTDADSAITALEKMTVTGRSIRKTNRVMLKETEQVLGIQDNLDDLVYMKPGTDRVAESGSSMLIRGGGPYDYRYYIRGIPVLTASHFTNHSFADQNAILVTDVPEMKVLTGRMAGRYAGASSGVIAIDPGVESFVPYDSKKRPEIHANLGSIGLGFSAISPFRKGEDLYRFGGTIGNSYLLEKLHYDYKSSSRASLNYGKPAGFQDWVFAGRSDIGKIRIGEYLWLAVDRYTEDSPGPSIKPWGLGAVTVSDTLDRSNREMTIGGSHQYVNEGKRIGIVTPLKEVNHSNAVIRAQQQGLALGRFGISFGGDVEYRAWDGRLDREWDRDSIRSGDTTQPVVRDAEEVCGSGQVSIFGQTGGFSYGANFLGGGTFPYSGFFVDPGLWGEWSSNNAEIGLNAGITSARPDIRGLPDSEYRSVLTKTYLVELVGGISHDLSARLSAETALTLFLKYRDRTPALSDIPYEPIWDPKKETPLSARGMGVQVQLHLQDMISLLVVQNLTDSRRLTDAGDRAYEWEMPWSTKLALRTNLLNEKISLYFSSTFAPGLPYREIAFDTEGIPHFTGERKRTPSYKRLDLKAQLNQDVSESRYLTRFSVYFELSNIINFVQSHYLDTRQRAWANTREFYWDDAEIKQSLTLDPARVHIGARLGFRM